MGILQLGYSTLDVLNSKEFKSFILEKSDLGLYAEHIVGILHAEWSDEQSLTVEITNKQRSIYFNSPIIIDIIGCNVLLGYAIGADVYAYDLQDLCIKHYKAEFRFGSDNLSFVEV